MAANVTRGDMRDRIRFEADMVNSTRATDANINALINVHATELYDRLVESGPPDYYKTSYAITTVAGTLGYAVPSDFRTVVGVFVNESSTRKREIFEMREGQRAAYDVPQGAYSMTLEYIPAFTALSADSGSGGVLDGISGWDELVVQLCARALRARDGRDVSTFSERIAELRARVNSNAPKRNSSGPKFIKDIESADAWPGWGSASVDAWTLVGSTLNLYQASAVWP